MHTDRALTYDAWASKPVAQQKCGYRIIRSIDKVLEDKAESARAFGETLKTLLKDANRAVAARSCRGNRRLHPRSIEHHAGH